ncbi:hypothetical protein J6590_026493 [Homalodisca vitripennis]|nr:hypothetical protein J6590_026493 [Homalodisca vitripennis]
MLRHSRLQRLPNLNKSTSSGCRGSLTTGMWPPSWGGVGPELNDFTTAPRPPIGYRVTTLAVSRINKRELPRGRRRGGSARVWQREPVLVEIPEQVYPIRQLELRETETNKQTNPHRCYSSLSLL